MSRLSSDGQGFRSTWPPLAPIGAAGQHGHRELGVLVDGVVLDVLREHPESVEAGGEVRRVVQVRAECLAFALRVRHAHGVWGGLSEDERQSLTAPSRET